MRLLSVSLCLILIAPAVLSAQTDEAALRQQLNTAQDKFLGLCRRMDASGFEERLQAYEELRAVGLAPTERFIGDLKKVREDRKNELLSRASPRALASELQQILAELEAARAAAMAAIFDLSVYPEENHGIAGQPTVDEKVKAVLVNWYPFAKLFERHPEWQTMVEDIAELDSYLKELTGGEEEIQPFGMHHLASEFNTAFQQSQISAADKTTLEFNESEAQYLYPGEAECILATNRYRLMMGLSAVETDLRLCTAARRHSREMRDEGYFAHESQGPHQAAHNSFADRCTHEGHTRPAGENIASGQRTGQDAFDGWYHSSGHHRNILGRNHKQIGLGYALGGQHGHLWTQVFGSDGGFRRESGYLRTFHQEFLKSDEHAMDEQLELAEFAAQNSFAWGVREQCWAIQRIRPDHPRARELLQMVGEG
ncbi:MAG: CAP domain-containing protein [Planctomycetes bacterium]|nr:CAP domain-containing protein [Planctomycetota bacterium]